MTSPHSSRRGSLHGAAAWLRGFCVATLAASIAGCGADRSDDTATEASGSRAAVLSAAPHIGRAADGFIGSGACKRCHAEEHGSWHDSYHRTMTQVAGPGSVLAPFDGVELHNRGRDYSLRREGDSFFVRLEDPAWDHPAAGKPPPGARPLVERRVVMTTGSHHMQVYWLESGLPEREHFILPFAYLLEDQRWVPREEAFVVEPDAGLMHAMWNDNCIRCHATGGQPGRRIGSRHFDTRVAELGIACEACHGPAAEHVRHHEQAANADGPPHAIVHPLNLPVVRQAQVCGQCHAISGPLTDVLDKQWFDEGYPYRAGDDLWATRGITRHPAKAKHPTPRTPPRNAAIPTELLRHFFWDDGMMRVSGREYNGLLETACYQRGDMTCLSCHSMHEGAPDDQLSPDKPGSTACVDCHQAIAEDVTAHTHHAEGSAGSSCLNCHMPHTSYGLYKAMRSHQISSPNARESLPPVGRPNACNLCHLDRSLAWTADHLDKWYGQDPPAIPSPHDRLAGGLVWLLAGEAGQRALIAWHMGWQDARRTAGDEWFAPALSIAAASDPYAAVRYIAARSLRRLPGLEAWTYDFLAPQSARTAAGKRAYEVWLAGPRPPNGPGARMGFAADGSLDLEAAMRLQRRRDDRPVFLGE